MKLKVILSSLFLVTAFASTPFIIEELSAADVLCIMESHDHEQALNLVQQFEKVETEQLQMLDSEMIYELMVEVQRETYGSISFLAKIPAKFFKDVDLVKGLVDVADAGSIDAFVALLTPKQFKEFITIADRFPEISVQFFSQLERRLKVCLEYEKLPKYMQHVTSEFLSLVFRPYTDTDDSEEEEDRDVGPLSSNVIKLLPENFLSEVSFPPHPDDGEHWTKEQLGRLQEDYSPRLVVSRIPPENINYITNLKAIHMLISTSQLTVKQLMALSNETWNVLLADKNVCCYLPCGLKFRNVSELNFTAGCFARLHPSIQSSVLVNHKSLPEDILCRITEEMSMNWFFRKSSGLEILKYVNDKSIIKHLGSHKRVDASNHPLAGMSINEVKSINDLYANLTGSMIQAMNLDFPTDIRDFKKDADVYCAKRGVVAAIEDLWEVKSEEILEEDEKAIVEESFWSTLSAEEAAKFFGPDYSIVLSEMNKASFLKLAANKAAISAVNPVLFSQVKYVDELPSDIAALIKSNSVKVKTASLIQLPDIRMYLSTQNCINTIFMILFIILFYRTA